MNEGFAESIRAAARGLAGIAERTPLLELPGIPGDARLKAEHRQPIGAFKIRGAYTALNRLSDAERARGVVTHSSGNHGQAVAFAARQFGNPARHGLPADAAPVTREAGEGHGGESH